MLRAVGWDAIKNLRGAYLVAAEILEIFPLSAGDEGLRNLTAANALANLLFALVKAGKGSDDELEKALSLSVPELEDLCKPWVNWNPDCNDTALVISLIVHRFT